MAQIPQIFSLHRYFIWANRMRTHFDEIIEGGLESASSKEGIESYLYMSYWYAGLYVVIEGWRELGLSHPQIDNLLESPNVELLRRYRNGVFHYQSEYYDNRFMEFMQQGEDCVEWVRDLNLEFGAFFLQWHKEIRGD